MWPLQVFVVSLLLPSGTLAVSSLSPLDLFAYPAYAVRLNPSNPISNTTAERILAAGYSSQETSSSSSSSSSRQDELEVQNNKKLDSLGLGVDDDARRQSQQPLLSGPSKPYLLRSAGNGQAYLCSVPQPDVSSTHKTKQTSRPKSSDAAIPTTAEDKARQKTKVEEEKKQAFERGLALLEPLKGNCLYNTQGWFTYAFCYGSEIRQFHAIKNKNPQGPPLIEDLTQEAYTLGLWSNRLAEGEGLVDIKKGRALGSLREILESEDKSEEHALEVMNGISGTRDEDAIGDEKRYLVQRWTGGTLCDKTGVDRHIEVQFHCNSQSSDRIFLVRETAICEYVIVIHTPRLCGEQIFVGGTSAADDAAEKRKKEVNVIECRPVIRDELFMHYLENGIGAEQKGQAQPGLLESGQPGANSDEVPADAQANTGQEAAVEEENNDAISNAEETATGDVTAVDANKGSHDTAQHTDHKVEQTDGQEEEVVIDSYVLAYDTATGQMTIERDPTGLKKRDVDGVKEGEGQNAATDEDAAMQDLLSEFKKSLQEALGGVDRDARAEARNENDALQEIIKQAREAVFRALKDGSEEKPKGGQDTPIQAQGTEGSPSGDNAQAGEVKSRLTRTRSHNHRDVAERYLKGLGNPPGAGGKIGKYRRPFDKTAGGGGGAQRPPPQSADPQKLGTPQYRNLKRAFEQKWDDDEGSTEDKGVKDTNIENGAVVGGHDEL